MGFLDLWSYTSTCMRICVYTYPYAIIYCEIILVHCKKMVLNYVKYC